MNLDCGCGVLGSFGNYAGLSGCSWCPHKEECIEQTKKRGSERRSFAPLKPLKKKKEEPSWLPWVWDGDLNSYVCERCGECVVYKGGVGSCGCKNSGTIENEKKSKRRSDHWSRRCRTADWKCPRSWRRT